MLNGTLTEGGGVPGFALPMFHNRFPISLSFRCGYPPLIGLRRAEPRKSGRTRATPPKTEGSCGPDSGTEFHTAIRPHAGSLSSSLIPAGRLGTAPRRGAQRRETHL